MIWSSRLCRCMNSNIAHVWHAKSAWQRPGRQKKANLGSPLRNLAEWTGLEPATPGVTGRYSNQLNYHSSQLRARLPPAQLQPSACSPVGGC